MTNVQASEAGFFSRQPATTHDRSTDSTPRHGRRNLALGLVVAVVGAAAAGAVYVRSNTASDAARTAATSTSALATAVQVMDAYEPGGSVYNEQVPAEARQDLSAFAPGGSVYRQQVPSGLSDDLTAYGPGSSVYRQQVPQQ